MRMGVSVSGFEKVAEALKRCAGNVGPEMDEMMDKGGTIIKEEWEQGIAAHNHVDTGAMIGSVGPKDISAGSRRGIAVYPQGTDGKGVRNAEKAFLLHYGWKASGRRTRKGKKGANKGDHFVDEIFQKSEPRVGETLESIADRYMNV